MSGRGGLGPPIAAGVVASLVGFASTFALVLAGLRAAGADEREAASGLLALSLLMGVTGAVLAWRTRVPTAVAWSTPGAALLISGDGVPGGWPAAVGAFAATGVLVVLAGLWRRLPALMERIPTSLAAAMLAGVLLPVCLAPVQAAVELPALALPAIGAWLVLSRVARPWAVPGALVAAAVAVLVSGERGEGSSVGLLPVAVWTTPAFDAGALLSVAVPLFVVTMASQNLPGVAVLTSFGFRAPLRASLLGTGAATVASAPLGGHAINLAAITAAMVAGPDAGPDPSRRWIAAVSGGATYLVLGLGAGAVVTAAAAAPALLVEAVAGLAILGALGASLATAAADEARRDAVVVTFVTAASGITVAGVSAPFWGLVAGLVVLAVRR